MNLERLTRDARSGDTTAASRLLREAQRRGDVEACYVAAEALLKGGVHEPVLTWIEGEARTVFCRPCGGCGFELNAPHILDASPLISNRPCKACGGRGRLRQSTHRLCSILNRVGALTRRWVECERCDGTGDGTWLGENGSGPLFDICDGCDGTGQDPHPDNPDPERIVQLWDRLGRLWHPGGWFEWCRQFHPPTWATDGGWCVAHGPGLTRVIVYRDRVEFSGNHVPELPEVPECVCVGAGAARGMCPAKHPTAMYKTHQQLSIIDAWVSHCTVCGDTNRCPRCGGDP